MRRNILPTLCLSFVIPTTAASAQSSPQQAALTLSTGGQSDCQGRNVRIEGDGQSYNLLGGCRSVTVAGSNNSVHAELESGATVSAGHANRIFWFLAHGSQAPAIVDAGTDSQVLQEQRLGGSVLPSSATPPDENSLTISGEKLVKEADCYGRDAVVHADDVRIVLRGRCRSVTVAGNNDVVEVEMLAGSRIRIDGNHSVVQFVLVNAGPDPIVSAEGRQSAAWRIQRLGAADRADASHGVSPTMNGMVVQGGKGAAVDQMAPVPARDPQ